jgi:methanogenic corrinoid protein MtbC1
MAVRQNKSFSPRQVGKALGVSEASIKRWCDKGILSFAKTAGGHRRLTIRAILDFVSDNGFYLAHPEVLGLPSSVGRGARTLEQARRLYREALEEGDEAKCLQLTLDMHLAGHDMAVIGDEIIARAFHEIGERWDHGQTTVYQERRGVEITRQVLTHLKETLPRPAATAPKAIGGTLAGDPYTLPGHLCELVLLELGWDARFLGSELPLETVAAAVHDLSPRLLWLSFSCLDVSDRFTEDWDRLYETCLAHHCAVVVGGRALKGSVRQKLKYGSYGDNLQHLRGFAQSL